MVLVAVAVGLPGLIPPVPLRMEAATFSSGIDSKTLALADTLSANVSVTELGGSIFVLAEVFAPSALPAHVRIEWRREGEIFRLSREVGIMAHAGGFRIWDAYHAPSGSIAPGRYRVVLRTSGRRVFGVATLTVDE